MQLFRQGFLICFSAAGDRLLAVRFAVRIGLGGSRLVLDEEHQVLPREFVELADELKPDWRELFQNLLFAHFVQQLDRHLWVFQPKLDQRNPAAGLSSSHIAASIGSGSENS